MSWPNRCEAARTIDDRFGIADAVRLALDSRHIRHEIDSLFVEVREISPRFRKFASV